MDRETAHYLTRVHRFSVGQFFVAFDPEQVLVASAEIQALDSHGVTCLMHEPEPARVPDLPQVHLIQALGKGDKPDRVVRDVTTLGVASLRFVETERTVVHLRTKSDTRLARWHEIAIDAARQSGRPDLPKLKTPIGLGEALAALEPGGARLLLDAEGEGLSLLLGQVATTPAPVSVTLLIGPEGGLSNAEKTLASGSGFSSAMLGPYTLRTETAACAAVSAVLSLLGQRR